MFFYNCVFSTNNYLIKGSALTYRHVILLILVSFWTASCWLRSQAHKNIPTWWLWYLPGDYFQVQLQKHLGLFLDPKLSFDEHIQCILVKTRKIIGLIRKLQSVIPRATLLTIYKSFLKPQLDYRDVIYDRAFNKSFQIS